MKKTRALQPGKFVRKISHKNDWQQIENIKENEYSPETGGEGR